MPDRDVPRVLVVDDDARVRHFLTTALGAAGFAVTATGTGEEGLRLAAARPDLVVLDVDLPDLSGREVCRRLKVAEETAIIPVLMLSGVFTDVADRSQALEDGSDAYLIKPVTSRELVAMARALLRAARAERRSHEHQRAAEELRRRVAQSKAMVDVARAIIEAEGYRAVLSVPLLAGDRALGAIVVYRALVGPFSEDDIDITQVFAAQAAVAMENADLYRRASERAEKLTTLSALTRLITGAASSHEVRRVSALSVVSFSARSEARR